MIGNRAAAEIYERLTSEVDARQRLAASRSDEAGRCVALVYGDPAFADEDDHRAGTLVRALRARAAAAGWDVLSLAPTAGVLDVRLAHTCAARGADAIIVLGGRNESEDLESRLPTILVECDSTGARSGQVSIDNYGAFVEVVRHLGELGCSRIAHVTGDLSTRAGTARLRGYRAALAELGLPLRPAYFVRGDFEAETAYASTLELLALPEPPEAIAAASDAQAVGVLKALGEAGLRCPEDVVVTGFDDAPFAAALGLTSVRPPIVDLGVRAFDAAVELVRDPGAQPPVVMLEAELVVRDSSQPRQQTRAHLAPAATEAA